ncbi:hypothetical protein PR202_gb28305 [Eleusine coracana subsp. coracana]|uniref:Protein kinase domain-containing protein n=1 Tax=Eleusine coracana subsp. coracana TaxID=191504 RepID=A0AAV5FWQ6_ELECO|nr:hypothetical protein PR202_gb28305 [Eleusine coracana subsp. coracana]
MASLGNSSSGLWSVLGQASSVAQLVGVDALGLVSMVVQAALAARRHRDACRRLAQHVELVGGLLRELELSEMMRREATRRPLEQLEGALRRCYTLVKACQDCGGFVHHLLVGARMAEELRSAEQEIDMFIRLVPLIALVDTSHDRRAKAQLTDGTMVAIKRLEDYAGDFNSELQLASLQHVNIIRLLGWCVHGKERILVYEFMHNGSLDRIIFDRAKAALLSWYKRFQIIKGLAEGLVYMHKYSLLWIIHGDLKPNNVLLDHNMNPKIADFGSARTLNSDIAKGHMSRIVGTSGYMAPEYASRGLYSVKIDVFGFGVLALVIISGRKNRILELQGDTVGNLVRDAWQLWNDGRLHELVDPLLSDRNEIDEIVRCAHVALLCAQEDPEDRPTMSDVVALLNFESTSLLHDPKPPSELIKRGDRDDKLSTCIGQANI